MKENFDKLVKKYQLAPKEASVFAHLVKGYSAKEIAQLENITYETSRWYIKQIYQKTGVGRQTELMRLVME